MTGCMVCLILLAALSASYAGTTNKHGLDAGVFFFFLFVALYVSSTSITFMHPDFILTVVVMVCA